MYPDVVNWIYVKPSSALGNSPTIVIPSGVLKNQPYENSWTFLVRILKGGEVKEKYQYTVSISAEPMTTAAFDPNPTGTYYKNTEYQF